MISGHLAELLTIAPFSVETCTNPVETMKAGVMESSIPQRVGVSEKVVRILPTTAIYQVILDWIRLDLTKPSD